MIPLILTLYCVATLVSSTPIVEHGRNDGHEDEVYRVPEDGQLSALELVDKYGYVGEAHRVITRDNYILEVHRITGSKKEPIVSNKPVILVMHGLLASSASWIVNGPGKALAYVLADAGYDVWLGNSRGSMYSRHHVRLTTDDNEYWGFSWHEMGVYDLPATIDYITRLTKQEKIFYIGHSQGTTMFFVMCSEKPEYQEKIEAMFALAPVTYSSRMVNPVFQFLSQIINSVEKLTELVGLYEFQPTGECLKTFASFVCDEKMITQPICSNVLFLFGGFSNAQLNKTLLTTILGHTPAGASTRQFVHYGQLIKTGKFRQFDHGLRKNWRIYKQLTPPDYDLGRVKVPVYLHYSTNDWLAHPLDVHKLYGELGNPIAKFRVPDDRFNHLDFMWGIDAYNLVYSKILSLITYHKQNKGK